MRFHTKKPKTARQQLSLKLVIATLSAAMACAAWADESPHCRYVALKTVPITFNGYRLMVNGTINDKPTLMYFDTGANTTLLTMNGAERLGLELGHSRAVNGIGGMSNAYWTLVDKISIGPIQGKRVKMKVFEDAAAGLNNGVDAWVGADFLFQNDLEMSLADQQLKFFTPLNCSNESFLAYWDKNASYVTAREAAIGDDRNPGDPGQEVIVEVNGKKVRAKIDSGAPESIIDIRAAEAAGVSTSSPGVVKLKTQSGGVGSHRGDIWRAPFNTVALGDETITNAKLRIADLWGANQEDGQRIDLTQLPEMLLGVDFLKAHRVLFAIGQHRFYFSYLGGKVFGGEVSKAPWQKDAPKQVSENKGDGKS